jgi:hypothetical protein
MSLDTSGSTHVVFRGGSFGGMRRPIDTVEAHNEVVEAHGTVLFGKSGRAPSRERFAILRSAIDKGSAEFILVSRRHGSHQVWKAPFVAIRGKSERVALQLIPSYYRDQARLISVWFEIGLLDPVPVARLDQLALISNGRSLRRVLDTSRTALLVVKG